MPPSPLTLSRPCAVWPLRFGVWRAHMALQASPDTSRFIAQSQTEGDVSLATKRELEKLRAAVRASGPLQQSPAHSPQKTARSSFSMSLPHLPCLTREKQNRISRG
jgi:hypothetical protein